MISLVMNPGLPDERVFALSIGTVTIGRTKDNVVYCLDKSLSRKHAQLDYDGISLTLTDLESKNGVFVKGRRIGRCELVEGDTFRCGNIHFLLEAATIRSPRISQRIDLAAQTLPSPLATPSANRHAPRNVTVESDQRLKDRLFLLLRASELCVSEMTIDNLLDELVVLAVQAFEVERIALLAFDDTTLEMRPRVVKSFVSAEQQPYSKRVVDWVVDKGSPTCLVDVSRDRTLPGNIADDANIRGAMCVPINPGAGTIGVIYADSLSRPDCFRSEDLALLRAIANLAALAIDNAALRSSERRTLISPIRT